MEVLPATGIRSLRKGTGTSPGRYISLTSDSRWVSHDLLLVRRQLGWRPLVTSSFHRAK